MDRSLYAWMGQRYKWQATQSWSGQRIKIGKSSKNRILVVKTRNNDCEDSNFEADSRLIKA